MKWVANGLTAPSIPCRTEAVSTKFTESMTPKNAVMTFELEQTALTRTKNNKEVEN